MYMPRPVLILLINTLAGYLKMANGHQVAFAIMNQNITF